MDLGHVAQRGIFDEQDILEGNHVKMQGSSFMCRWGRILILTITLRILQEGEVWRRKVAYLTDYRKVEDF